MSITELPRVDTSSKTQEDQTTSDVDYKIASTREERAEAFRLVYKAYLRAGLGEPNEHGMRVTPYHMLPTTEVFVAICRQETIFTVTLINDGELGLPMETVYASEVERLRVQGLRIAEVSCLADRRSEFRRCFPVFLRLCRFTAQYAWRIGLEQLLVAVHPKHARFYKRFMDFEPIGELRSYPAVRNRPAVAMMLDMVRLHRERSESYYKLFAPVIDHNHLKPQPITHSQSEYFCPLVDSTFNCAPIGNVNSSDHNTGENMLAATA